MGSNGTSAKVAIITAIISSVTTILVTFIGIIPQFYERKAPSPGTQKTCTISGTITSSEAKPLRNAEIYLIRATGSEFMATTDDAGKFTFHGLPVEAYWVVVRNNVSEKASRVLVGDTRSAEEVGEVEVVESSLRYKYTKCDE